MRKIIHIDMDCFYAAVEARDNPALRGKPIAVGGNANQRGVLCTASYEARKFGVRSAMPTSRALRLCPDLILLPVNMPKYREASDVIRSIFHEFTPLVEPLSLDEAYLDVSDCEEFAGSATLIAAEIRRRIQQQTQLTASAGISSNKFVAKVCSDWNKPNGQTVITPDKIDEFVRVLPVKKIFGVGPVTAKKLEDFGVTTCEDLRPYTEDQLFQRFGNFGERLFQLCRGIDHRPVKPNRIRKTISVEQTFLNDTADEAELVERLIKQTAELQKRYAKISESYQVAGINLKLKWSDFQTATVSEHGARDWKSPDLAEHFIALFKRAGRLPGQPLPQALRLLGVGFRLDTADAGRQQFDLFAGE
jgi:DNA polymerase-4